MYSKINNPRLREYKKTDWNEMRFRCTKILLLQRGLRPDVVKTMNDKDLGKLLDDADLLCAEQCCETFKPNHPDHLYLKLFMFRMYRGIKKKEFQNYFIEDDVLQILESIPLKNDDNFESLLNNVYGVNAEEKSDITGFIFTKKDASAIAFNFMKTNAKEDVAVCWDNGNYNYGLQGVNDTDFSIDDDKKENKRIIRIIVNLFYYLNAYPDSVISKPPDEVKDKLNKDNSIRITVSEEMKPYLQRDMMPHLRRGHFRYLGSDYYKKKKGQTIFIHPVFVGGEAKTVINSDRVIQ